MRPLRIAAVVAAVIAAPPVLVVVVASAFRGLCADRELQRKASPDGRTVATELDQACLTKHVTAAYLERPGLPGLTLVRERAKRVQGVELAWRGDRELWVTLVASPSDAADAAEDAPRRFDDVTIRYFDRRGELHRNRE